jgi:hypothetical protein
METGKDSGPYRLAVLGNIYSSPVAAAGRVYITDRDGVTLVIKHDDNKNPDVLAVNRLGDTFNASAALAGREMFLRGEKVLYCIAE